MRYYFFDRRKVLRGIILCFSAGSLLLFGALYFGRAETLLQDQPVYQGSPGNKEIALTVNVFWGEEYIPQMLDILRQNEVKATFFLGGTWVVKYPELAAAIAREGHEIGSHGYSHPHPDRLSKSENLKDMQKAEDIIYRATGTRPRIYAPPYGERGPTVLRAASEASYTTILWSIDTVDWQLPPAGVISQRVLGKAHNGAIVLMHPTAPTVKALPEIIQGLKKEGYRLVIISRILEGLTAAESSVGGRRMTI